MSIIYLDTSALLKLYVQELHSDEVRTLVDAAEGVGTCVLTYPEMAAAMARAGRMQLISVDTVKPVWHNFVNDWPDYTRLNISTPLIERAASLAWEYGLRGYDAMHLSAALIWQDAIDERIILATFDRLLWGAGMKAGILVWPEELT